MDCKKHDLQSLALIATSAKSNGTKVIFENYAHLSDSILLRIALIGRGYVSFNTPV